MNSKVYTNYRFDKCIRLTIMLNVRCLLKHTLTHELRDGNQCQVHISKEKHATCKTGDIIYLSGFRIVTRTRICSCKYAHICII